MIECSCSDCRALKILLGEILEVLRPFAEEASDWDGIEFGEDEAPETQRYMADVRHARDLYLKLGGKLEDGEWTP